MSKTVLVAQATDDEAVLPERGQEALGQLVGAAKKGLLALSVSIGLGVLSELLEEEVDQVVGPTESGTLIVPLSGTATGQLGRLGRRRQEGFFASRKRLRRGCD